jgi:hypothetical protein
MLGLRYNRGIFLGSILVQVLVVVERVGGQTGVQEYDENMEKKGGNREERTLDMVTKSELYEI